MNQKYKNFLLLITFALSVNAQAKADYDASRVQKNKMQTWEWNKSNMPRRRNSVVWCQGPPDSKRQAKYYQTLKRTLNKPGKKDKILLLGQLGRNCIFSNDGLTQEFYLKEMFKEASKKNSLSSKETNELAFYLIYAAGFIEGEEQSGKSINYINKGISLIKSKSKNSRTHIDSLLAFRRDVEKSSRNKKQARVNKMQLKQLQTSNSR